MLCLYQGGVIMTNNLEQIKLVIDYIEEHLLLKKLDLDTIAKEMNYSKYHLHRMFSGVVGFTMHQYIIRRCLSEAARLLIYSNQPIIQIAMLAGYDSQRSFSKAFKKLYKVSPKKYRSNKEFLPVQLKFEIDQKSLIGNDMILDVKIIIEEAMNLVGYQASTNRGFYIIGKCWKKLHHNKDKIKNQNDKDFLIGFNDYSNYEVSNNAVFNYFAGVQVASFKDVDKKMQMIIVPKNKYVVFTFRGKNEDSMQPIIEYIYNKWLVNSSCQLSDQNLYDFVKYGNEVDEFEQSEIQYWVPIK